MILTFDVPGIPQPQGSTKAFINKKTGRPIITSSNRNLKPWRAAVAAAAAQEMRSIGNETATASVSLMVMFRFPRPVSHYGKKGLLPSAPSKMRVRPDLDKLVRAIGDALKDAGVYKDDSQVTEISAFKDYAPDAGSPGALVMVTLHWNRSVEQEVA